MAQVASPVTENPGGFDKSPDAVAQATLYEPPQENCQVGVSKKKRKKKRSATRGPGGLGKKGGTGFEEFFCDPPMTPQEALEEQTKVYPPNRPFVERIRECVQRYRARRRLGDDRGNIFDKFLALGGIESHARQAQSTSNIAFEGETPVEVKDAFSSNDARLAPQDSRFYDPNHPAHWDVDFTGVVSGFFSERIFKLTASDAHLVNLAIGLIRNFLNYILHHDVCPEYADDIEGARAICDQALDQIPSINAAWVDVPGDFNLAARTLYCPQDGHDSPYQGTMDGPMDQKRAKVIFMAAVAAMDRETVEAFSIANKANTVKLTSTTEKAFEIVALHEPDADTARMFLGVKDPASGAPGTVDPCGSVVLRPTIIRDGWDRGPLDEAIPDPDARETLVLNQKVMRHLVVGMKLRLVVCTLNTGIKFIKEFTEICPSYYTFLPQELMLAYKEPVPNGRPAPRANNPDAIDEEGADEAV